MRDPSASETYLYRIHDSAGLLVYVGVTVNPAARMQNHSTREWWPAEPVVTWEGPYPRQEALRRETLAIRSENPSSNGIRMSVEGDRRRLANYREYLAGFSRPLTRFEWERLDELETAVRRSKAR